MVATEHATSADTASCVTLEIVADAALLPGTMHYSAGMDMASGGLEGVSVLQQGADGVKSLCDLQIVMRSKVLQELASIAAADAGRSSITLPLSQDAFTTWLEFERLSYNSSETLCCVLQVCASATLQHACSACIRTCRTRQHACSACELPACMRMQSMFHTFGAKRALEYAYCENAVGRTGQQLVHWLCSV
jgi:hypothetical protein